MKKLTFILLAAFVAGVLPAEGKSKPKPETLRLLYWNIQNGMWDGQNDNYDRFV